MAPGAAVVAAVHQGPGSNTDWVGLYQSGAPPTSFLQWRYLNGAQSPPASGLTEAMLTFNAPNTLGSYEMRLLASNSYNVVSTAAFQVGGASGGGGRTA